MIFRLNDVKQATGLSRSTIYAQIADGAFPRPVKLGKRAVGWREADLQEWLSSRPNTGQMAR
ncbi:helix-turn-helix transcriptional regulator [Lentibacter sp.]|uniref:helix-turn-helix transcriptional regulator n=1 Tax=Lentibacter sp. TaxID=2024994 RepID=UPI003F6B9D11